MGRRSDYTIGPKPTVDRRRGTSPNI